MIFGGGKPNFLIRKVHLALLPTSVRSQNEKEGKHFVR
jgi:hypothetical protein